MAEVLFLYDTPLALTEGPSYSPRACGREMEDGLWEGWIEFLPDAGSHARAAATPGPAAGPRHAGLSRTGRRASAVARARGLSVRRRGPRQEGGTRFRIERPAARLPGDRRGCAGGRRAL